MEDNDPSSLASDVLLKNLFLELAYVILTTTGLLAALLKGVMGL